MASRIPTSRIGWRWSLIALACLAWLSIGCSPSSISMLLLPWNDAKVDPTEYKLFAKDSKPFAKEDPVTLVIITDFAQPPFDADLAAVERELPDQLAQFFRKRSHDNKHKLKIVPQAEVDNWKVKLRSEGAYDPVEVGKHFNADYVLTLNIRSCSLIAKNYEPKAYKGVIDMLVNLHKVNPKDEDGLVLANKDARFEFPGSLPIDVGSMNAAAFRRMFLTKVARDVTKMFMAFPQDEKNPMDLGS